MFKKVLVGTDGSKDAARAVAVARELGFVTKDSEVDLLAGLSGSTWFKHGFWSPSEEQRRLIREGILQKLEELKSELEAAGLTVKAVRVFEENPAESLAKVSELEEKDLVIVGHRSFGALRRLFQGGSVSQKLVELSTKPVLVVPEGDYQVPASDRKVVVGTDFSGASKAALRLSCEVVDGLGAGLHIVHAGSFEGFNSELTAVLDRKLVNELQEKYMNGLEQRLRQEVSEFEDQGFEVSSALTMSEPWLSLEAEAERINAVLIVVASHGRAGFQKLWYGSVTERLIKKTRRPVLVSRADEA